MEKDLIRRAAELMFRTNKADIPLIASKLQLEDAEALRVLQELEQMELVVREGDGFLVATHEVVRYLLDALQLDQDKFDTVVGKAVDAAKQTGGYVTFEQVSEWMIGIEKNPTAREETHVETGSADFEDAVEDLLSEISGFDILLEQFKAKGIEVIGEQDVDRWNEMHAKAT